MSIKSIYVDTVLDEFYAVICIHNFDVCKRVCVRIRTNNAMSKHLGLLEFVSSGCS